MKNTATAQLAHRVNTLTTATGTYQTHCDGCNWTSDERNTEFAADIEGMMHEFNGNS